MALMPNNIKCKMKGELNNKKNDKHEESALTGFLKSKPSKENLGIARHQSCQDSSSSKLKIFQFQISFIKSPLHVYWTLFLNRPPESATIKKVILRSELQLLANILHDIVDKNLYYSSHFDHQIENKAYHVYPIILYKLLATVVHL